MSDSTESYSYEATIPSLRPEIAEQREQAMSAHYAQYKNHPEFRRPGHSRGLIDVFKNRYLLSLLTNKGIATRYYGSVLGWVWSYIRPAAQFLMYYLVVGLVFGATRGIDFYPIYLFCGIVGVGLFSEILRNATSSIVDNRGLVRKIFLPRELFPVSSTLVAMVHFLPQASLLLIIAIIFGWKFSFTALLSLLGGVLLLLVFGLGVGMFFGGINAIYRDAKNIVDLILMYSTWASPVLYSFQMIRDIAPSWFYHIYMSNPVTVAIELIHDGIWLPISPGAERPGHMSIYILAAVGISILSLFFGQLSFRKMEGIFAQRL
ncbi:ABC transporter permease [Canibacter zhoujuaniae]|uniref:ABC transporter permease n=1 Tax=Canibacter zhoujuaniae TaxID=2708343 RepID=UPI001FBB47F1|nr:ABC transporter permease [Canibacter zhoujuaniae]